MSSKINLTNSSRNSKYMIIIKRHLLNVIYIMLKIFASSKYACNCEFRKTLNSNYHYWKYMNLTTLDVILRWGTQIIIKRYIINTSLPLLLWWMYVYLIVESGMFHSKISNLKDDVLHLMFLIFIIMLNHLTPYDTLIWNDIAVN